VCCVELLQKLLDVAVRKRKRNTAPFSRDNPKPNPKTAGRKPGQQYGKQATRPTPLKVDEQIAVPLPPCCPHCESHGGVKQGNLSVMHKAKKQLDEMIPGVQQVMRQTRERVLRGNTQAEGKLLSVFETHTEVIRKGKANKPNEFGKLVLIQEAENQIVTHYQCLRHDLREP
jgi:hypothetical protein